MTLRNYCEKQIITTGDETKFIIDCELISTDLTEGLPTNAMGITGFPACYPADKVQFGAGSILYVVSTGDIYMADETGTFQKQTD